MRHLQLRRSSVENIYPNRAAAIKFINETLINTVVDGEPILARYRDAANEICVILGYAIVLNATEKTIYLIDNTDIIEEINRIEIAAGIDEKGNYVKNALARFIQDAVSLNDADVKLDANLANTVDAVGLKSDDGTYVPMTGSYVDTATTIKEAIEDVDTILVNNVTALGTKEEDGTYVTMSGRYVPTATTFKQANEILDTIQVNAIDAVGLKAADGKYVAMNGRYVSAATTFKEASEDLSEIQANAVDALGLNRDDAKYVPMSGTYIDAATTFKGAIESLDAEITDRLKIDSVANTSSVALSVDTITSPNSPTLKANVTLAPSVGATGLTTNILKVNADGVFANVYLSYEGTDNSLTFNNGVENKKIALNAGSIIDGMVYEGSTETLVITYHTTSSTTPKTVVIPLADLITEYEFINQTDDITYDGNKGNVLFKIDRNVNGQSEIRADINVFDCGTY